MQNMQFWVNVATLATAITALFTILEMRWQRRSSYKPDLLVGGSAFADIRYESGHRNITSTRGGLQPDDEASSLNDVVLSCVNVGTGPAKNVVCQWTCDFLAFAETVGAMDPDAASAIEFDDTWLHIEAPPQSSHHLTLQMEQNILWIAANGQQSINIPVPYAYLALLSMYFDCATQVKGDPGSLIVNLPDPIGAMLTMTYHDLEEGKHMRRFSVRPRLIALSRNLATDSKVANVLARGLFEITAA